MLANPLELAVGLLKDYQLLAVFEGMLHGDLHRENLFWERRPHSDNFWLIDFALAQPGPLFFDQAYLELSLLLQKYAQADHSRLLNLLDCLIHPRDQLGANFVSPEDYGILTITRSLRDGINDWQKTEQELRPDAVNQQWCLARVAAGLNWANKRIADKLQHLAFAYAAHAAKDYLSTFHSAEWKLWASDCETAASAADKSVNGAIVSEPAWQEIWQEMLWFFTD